MNAALLFGQDAVSKLACNSKEQFSTFIACTDSTMVHLDVAVLCHAQLVIKGQVATNTCQTDVVHLVVLD